MANAKWMHSTVRQLGIRCIYTKSHCDVDDTAVQDISKIATQFVVKNIVVLHSHKTIMMEWHCCWMPRVIVLCRQRSGTMGILMGVSYNFIGFAATIHTHAKEFHKKNFIFFLNCYLHAFQMQHSTAHRGYPFNQRISPSPVHLKIKTL